MQVPADWKRAVVHITPGFEIVGSDPYLGVAGDFDGMGISCGALQWNIGSGSLQPMVKAVGRAVVIAAMPTLGQALWAACNASIAKGLAAVRAWQTGTRLSAVAKAELRALMGTPEMRAQQGLRIDKVAATAFRNATDWAQARGDSAPSKRLFCWFFDLVTQNGGLEGLTHKRVKDFIEQTQPDRTDDLICDFLAGRTGASGHVRDAKRNADLWRNRTDAEKLELLAMSYLRAQTSSPTWRHVVLNRKGAIAMGKGWVNSALYDFSAYGL